MGDFKAPAARWSGNQRKSPSESAEKSHVTDPWALRDLCMLVTWIAYVQIAQRKFTTYTNPRQRRFYSETRRGSVDAMHGIHATGRPLSLNARATLERMMRTNKLPIPDEPTIAASQPDWVVNDGRDKPLKPPARKGDVYSLDGEEGEG